jgi:hypothetical protein
MSEWEQPPEHPLSVHDHQFVSIEHPLNTHWVRMNAIESLLNATHHGVTMSKFSFVSELNTPWRLVSEWEHCLNTHW